MCCELQAKYGSIDELTQLCVGGMQRYLNTLLKDAHYTTQSGKEVRNCCRVYYTTSVTAHHSILQCVYYVVYSGDCAWSR
jgi:hypothetical protein